MANNMLTENQEGDLHNINYRVVENSAASYSKGSTVYSGQVLVKETYGLTDVARRMVAEGCAVKESTIRLVLSEFAGMVAELVSEGRAVNISGLVRQRHRRLAPPRGGLRERRPPLGRTGAPHADGALRCRHVAARRPLQRRQLPGAGRTAHLEPGARG